MSRDFNAAWDKMRDNRRESRKWGGILSIFLLVCLCAFGFREAAGKKVDVLSGHSAIEIYLRNNRIGLVILGITLAVYILVLIKVRGIRKSDSIHKVMFVILAPIMIVFSFVAFILSSNNIYEDYKAATVYNNNEYVLCSSLSGAEHLYYVGFEQKGDYILLQIPEKTYDTLSEGEEDTEGTDSEIYTMIEDAGYNGTTLYKSDVEISYYFNSAILESAKLA